MSGAPTATPRDTYKSPIRLVVTDLDGTLLNQYNEIGADNIAAIHALQEAGIHFTFATGRLDCQTKIYIEELALDSPIISCNGALIRSGLTHEILHLERMAPEMVLRMVDFAIKLGMDFMVYDTDEVFYPPQSERVVVYEDYNILAAHYDSKPCQITKFDFVHHTAQIAERVCKIYLHSENPEKIVACREFAAAETNLIAVSSMFNNLDIAPPMQTKGNAIKWLAKHYHLSKEQICVFGDNDNDVSMLSEAGLGFAMSNGSVLAKAAAHLLAPPNTVSGVARALRQFVLP